MGLTVRDWMVIIGVLLIFAVLLDAYRRVRSDRREKTRVTMSKQVATSATATGDEQMLWLKELPNGGARIIERGDLLRSAADSRRAQEDARASEQTPEQFSGQSGDASESAPEEVQGVPLVTGMSSNSEPENLDWLDSMGSGETHESVSEEEVRLHRPLDPEVFMLNVVSRDANGFRGEDILHILLACDLRFGDMSFFHRHEQEAGRGPIQFSVANMVQPGVFDLDNMADMHTPGLVFFVTLPGPEDMMQAFDYMLETAQAVARNLDGDVLDESRSALTKQTLEHCRQQIRDLERRLLTASAR
jgi:cell division protein ZipA